MSYAHKLIFPGQLLYQLGYENQPFTFIQICFNNNRYYQVFFLLIGLSFYHIFHIYKKWKTIKQRYWYFFFSFNSCIHGNGSTIRNFIFVEDVVKGIDTLLHEGEPGEVYNIGTKIGITVLELARYLIRRVSCHINWSGLSQRI